MTPAWEGSIRGRREEVGFFDRKESRKWHDCARNALYWPFMSVCIHK